MSAPTYTLTDYSPMPFGKYRGKSLVDVPAVYLIWLHDQGITHEPLKKYVLENFDVLKKEANQAKGNR